MKNQTLWYMGGAAVILFLFRDILKTIVPGIGGAIGGVVEVVGGFFQGVAESMEYNVFDNAAIQLLASEGATAEIAYYWYTKGWLSYMAGYHFLQEKYEEYIGNVEYPAASTWCSEQLEEYASYGA